MIHKKRKNILQQTTGILLMNDHKKLTCSVVPTALRSWRGKGKGERGGEGKGGR